MKIIQQSVTVVKPKTPADGIALLKSIEFAGRNCYASHDKATDTSYEKFVAALISRGHEAPLEFGDITLDIVTSRAVMAELTRHRLSSFCVESQRYVQEARTGDISFILPDWIKTPMDRRSEGYKLWRLAMENNEITYKKLIAMGKKPEEAREVLPNSTACRVIMKANVREIRHVLNQRTSPAAYPQMHTLAADILEQVHTLIPVAFDDIYKRYNDERGKNHDEQQR